MRQKRKTLLRLVAQATNICALVPVILILIIAVFCLHAEMCFGLHSPTINP
jgi:hypothetical protein